MQHRILSLAIVLLAFLSLTLAQPLAGLQRRAPGHAHHKHKRQVVEVTVTVTEGADATAAAAAATTAPAAATTTPATTTSAGTSSSAAASASSSASVSSGQGVTYSPYNADGSCKSAAGVKADISALLAQGFSKFRIYAVDCNQVQNVFAAVSGTSATLVLGVFDMTAVTSSLDTIISVAGQYGWGQVEIVTIGNEQVNSGTESVDTMVSFTNAARTQLRAAGYTGSVATADTFVAIIANPQLCEASDVVTANCHAFFDGGVVASGAGAFVTTQIGRLQAACPGKSVVITESGWPSAGDTNGVAVPSEANQQAAIASLKSAVPDAFLFTAFNDLWKTSGAYNAEQYWGIEGTSSNT